MPILCDVGVLLPLLCRDSGGGMALAPDMTPAVGLIGFMPNMLYAPWMPPATDVPGFTRRMGACGVLDAVTVAAMLS